MDATWATVLILAVVQGIGEFLPISSSGHLVILNALLKERLGGGTSGPEDFELNIALHFGTLVSILVVYRRELREVLRKPKLCLAIVVATIPTAVLGLLFKETIKRSFSTPLHVGFCLLITAALLSIGQRFGRATRPLENLRLRDALVVGLFQSVSLMLRGVSRSGSTITGGLLMGLRRESAAAFSFLIAIPAIGGATVLMAKDLLQPSAAETRPADSEAAGGASDEAAQASGPRRITLTMLGVGAVVSCVVGLVSLKGLLRLISQKRLHWFAWYCLTAGLLTIAWQLSPAVRAGP